MDEIKDLLNRIVVLFHALPHDAGLSLDGGHAEVVGRSRSPELLAELRKVLREEVESRNEQNATWAEHVYDCGR